MQHLHTAQEQNLFNTQLVPIIAALQLRTSRHSAQLQNKVSADIYRQMAKNSLDRKIEETPARIGRGVIIALKHTASHRVGSVLH